MNKCIVIDDKQEHIDIIVIHLKSKPELQLIKTFTSSIKALEYITHNKVDLVFLDIDMPHLSGIELIESLQSISNFKVPHFILTTGHQEFALKGFEFGVVDYIMKPVSYKRFHQATERYIETKTKQNQENEIMNNDFFFAESDGKKIRINFEDIVYIEGSGNYISIFKNDKRVVLLKTLNDMETILNHKTFMRVHKSFIVSINHIEAYANGEAQLKYKEEVLNIPIGRTYKEEFKKRLNID
jgi:two-component system, LytTR family, response regulator